MKQITVLLSAVLMYGSIRAQQVVKTYYDYKKTKVHEQFTADAYGVKNGKYTEFSEFGGVLTEGIYKNDKKVGMWQFKDPKGLSTNIETYDVNGVKDGKWLIHCEFNPKFKYVEGSYKAGLKDGIWFEYECSSEPQTATLTLKSKEIYVAGQIDGPCEYFSKGVKTVGSIKGGKKVGEWKEFDEKGRLAVTYTYTGREIGPYTLKLVTVYYPDGKVMVKRNALQNYKDIMQTLIGEEIFYDSTGVLEARNVWNKDSIVDQYNDAFYTGLHEEYFPSGKVSFRCSTRFERGDRYWIGEKVEFTEDGKKLWEGKYDRNGNLIAGTYVKFLPNGSPDEKTRK